MNQFLRKTLTAAAIAAAIATGPAFAEDKPAAAPPAGAKPGAPMAAPAAAKPPVDTKALDAKCLDSLVYTPPFTTFNGWEP